MYLGIDIGTSAVKAVVIDDTGAVQDTVSASLNVSRPAPNWSEQNPDHWWAAVGNCIHQLSTQMRQNISAIGLSGQMHGATLLDRDDRPLRPAILWNDGRSAEECVALQNAEPDFLRRGANLVMPGFTAPKLAWVRQYEPDIFGRTATVLLPKDYVRLCMTGERASDLSDAAGTLWLDVAQRRWHAPLLSACGLNESHMPTLFEGPETTGHLRATLAQDWGMRQVPVMAGGSDNAAGAVGAGAIQDGDTILSLGTSGVIFTTLDTFRSNPASAVHAFCHALPNRWHLMSVMLSAASCLDWACQVTQTSNVAALLDLAESKQSTDSDVLFLPYLSGERTPHNDTKARGVLSGMTHETGPADIANAVLEGVAFGFADGFDALLSTGVTVPELSVIGGGSQSKYWGKILASILDRPLKYREESSVGPALGAARLALSGHLRADAAVVFAPPHIQFSVEPDSTLAAQLAPKRARFKALYQAIKPHF